jgi:AraC-like DNA-binding protein
MSDSFFEKYKTSEVTNTRRVINTPSNFTRENFLYIQEAGYLKSLKPHLSRRDGLDSYLFLVVLSGSGTVTYVDPTDRRRDPDLQIAVVSQFTSNVHAQTGSRGRSPADPVAVPSASNSYGDPAKPDTHARQHASAFAASAGDCFLLDCRNPYTHISSADDPWELMWIHFHGPRAFAYHDYFREQHDWHFRTSHMAELTAAIQSIITAQERSTDNTDILTAQQITNILTLICTESAAEPSSNSALSQKMKDVRLYLDAHFTEDITLDLLSEQFYISKYYLARAFKKDFGVTIIQYILAKKITNAKELLRYSDSSIEEIARLCGIDDASYFNKVFRKVEGCTASEYRKRW